MAAMEGVRGRYVRGKRENMRVGGRREGERERKRKLRLSWGPVSLDSPQQKT